MRNGEQAGAAGISITLFECVAIYAILLVMGASQAEADQLIISSDRVDQAVWGAAASDSYAQQPAQEIPFLEFTVELYRRNPHADPQQVLHYIDGMRALVQERFQRGDPSPPGQAGTGIASYDYYNGAVDVISSFPFAQYTFVPFVLTSMREANKLSESIYNRRMAPIYSLASLARRDAYAEAEKLNKQRVIQDALGMAQNPEAAAVIQALAQRSLGTAQQVFAANPAFASIPSIQILRSLMNDRGEIVTSTEQLRALFGTELQNLQNTVSSNLTLLHELAAGQQVLYSYMTNAELRALNQERIATAQAVYEQKIQAANASVYILSTLVGYDNPELGHQMQVVGNSTIQVADAIHKFTAAQASGLGGVILTGNLLGATMNVVALFSASGPSPDQQILQGIAQLRQQINQLRMEMHDRFDRVDAALNQIYDTMNDRFNRIDVTLGILVGNVQEIQESLYNLQSDLYRIERKMFAFLDAGFRFDLNEAINGALGYKENFGQPIPYEGTIPSFIWAENRFLTWAVDNSRNELLSGSSSRGYDDASLYAELTSQPLENNLNYISQFLATKSWPAFTTVRLANPRDWAIAANSWIELAAESPILFRRVSSNRLEQIYSVGLNLQKAVTSITLARSNAVLIANRSLFSALFANYRAKATTFKQALATTETAYRLSISQDPAKSEPLRNLNLWGGPSQATTFVSAISSIPPRPNDLTHGVTTNLAPPTGWQQMVPPPAFLADLIGVGPLSIKWGDYDVVDTFDGLVYLFSTYRGPVGSFQMAIKGEIVGQLVLYRNVRLPPVAGFVVNGVNYFSGYSTVPDAIYHNVANGASFSFSAVGWDWSERIRDYWAGAPLIGRSGKDFFVADSQNTHPEITVIALNQLQLLSDNRLRELQRGSYNFVSASLSQATSLQASANELSGAKALLESIISIGFPQSLDKDDFARALLFGNERVVDTDAAKELCNLGIARSYDTNQNAKVDIAAILDERVAGLETWVSNRLTQIQTNGYGESLQLVSSTLSRLDAFRALRQQPSPPPYLGTLAARLTNGIASRLFIPWGEPNVRYTVQLSTNLTQWTDLPTLADEGEGFVTTPSGRSGFYRAVLRP